MRRSSRIADKKSCDKNRADDPQTSTSAAERKRIPAKKQAPELSEKYGPSSKTTKTSISKFNEVPVIRNPQKTSAPENVASSCTNGLHHQGFLRPLKDHSEVTMSFIHKDPVHPDVRFKKLAFYKELDELVKPTSLKDTTIQTPLENQLVFYLTPTQADTIANSRYREPDNFKINYSVQVIMRFCLQETSYEQNDLIPPDVKVKVNGKNLDIPPGYKMVNQRPKALPIKPIDITGLVKLSSTVENLISIICPFDFNRKYVVAVYLAKKFTSYELTSQLKLKGIKHPDYTRVMIKEKLVEDPDCEIATTSLRVSLNCPLGKMKMNIPCRASTCNHLQCFDAAVYLEMNDCRPRWVCPVCSKPAPYDCLVIDGYFQQVLASDKVLPNVNEIQLLPDGSWENLLPKKDHGKNNKVKKEVMSSPNSTVFLDNTGVEDKTVEKDEKNLTVIDLVSSDDDNNNNDDDNYVERSHVHDGSIKHFLMKLSSSQKKSGEKSGKIVIIDLD